MTDKKRNNFKKAKRTGMVLMIAACLLATGCAPKGNNPSGSVSGSVSSVSSGSQAAQGETYYFENKGVKIALKAPTAPILAALGEPLNYFEAPSCAFEGMDKIYTYAGFEIHTYTQDKVDYVFSVLFTDDSVKTREGIALAATLEDVTAKYGKDYVESDGQYTYSAGDCQLSFLLEDGGVVSIEYSVKSDK